MQKSKVDTPLIGTQWAGFEPKCPFCHDLIRDPLQAVICSRCKTHYHGSCWPAAGCSIYGCGGKEHLLISEPSDITHNPYAKVRDLTPKEEFLIGVSILIVFLLLMYIFDGF